MTNYSGKKTIQN